VHLLAEWHGWNRKVYYRPHGYRQILQTKRLGASFFFSRDSGDVNHASKFFASIAVQLANMSDNLDHYICEAIKRQRDIAKGLRDQWRRLVYEPLSKLEVLTPPLLLVVDVLDECEEDDNVRLIIQLLAEARDLAAPNFLNEQI